MKNNKNKLSEEEKFQEGIDITKAKYYSQIISDNVKRAFEQKRRNGEWIGIAPIGYLNTFINKKTRTHKTIIIDKKRGPIIQKMFELLVGGKGTIKTIKEEASRMGLKGRNGSELSMTCVNNILKDPFYCGIAVSKKYGSYKHKYPNLISKELFDRCQSVLSKTIVYSRQSCYVKRCKV